jgi:hypothetical protein
MTFFIPAVVGLVAGVLGGLLGIGGSVIIIPAMIVYLSFTGAYAGNVQHLLQAAAMIANVFVAAPAVVAHYRAGAIMKPVVAFLIPSALLGVLVGVAVSDSSAFARQNGTYLAMVLAAFLLYVAAYNTWRLYAQVDLTRDFDDSRRIPPHRTVSVGLLMGFMAGLLGIGGGALCVPLQQILLRVPLRRAIANSAATIVCSATVGAVMKNWTLSSHGVAVTESLGLAAMLIPTAIVGGYLGGRLTHRLPRRALRLVFIVFMLTIAYLTFSRAWAATHATPDKPKGDRPQTSDPSPAGASRPECSRMMARSSCRWAP